MEKTPQEIHDVINPPMPETQEQARAIAAACMRAIKTGGIIEGVGAEHVLKDAATLTLISRYNHRRSLKADQSN